MRLPTFAAVSLTVLQQSCLFSSSFAFVVNAPTMTTTKSKSFNRLYVSAAPQNNNDVAKEDDDELSPEDIEFFQKNKIIM
mmetsp:Transcript_18923/g.29152  ORF Transcript_18923/g.29152 Transcript_18923/m.29152 type:complete len:80 (+) Transcript_18923:176-415(+)